VAQEGGRSVKSGDVIAEIETDKATMEVEAVDEGTLGKILVPEGTNDVAVNTPIAMILEEGEDASALKDGKPPARKARRHRVRAGRSPAPRSRGSRARAAREDPRRRRRRTPEPEPDVPEGPRWPP
jgi:pyruvate dehydrogenase E1 component beta subunit